jgi:enoyl-CoA hydratase/carnithine racemase
VRYAVEGTVAMLTFNRPNRLDAQTPEVSLLALDLLQRAAADAVRVVVPPAQGGPSPPGETLPR